MLFDSKIKTFWAPLGMKFKGSTPQMLPPNRLTILKPYTYLQSVRFWPVFPTYSYSVENSYNI